MKLFALFLACAVLCHRSAATPPNVVVFLVDDAGVEVFGCYGGESYETPRIDQMAREGVLFTRCHSQPLCTPSRVKLLTGRSNIRNYERFSVLRRDETTIADLLGAGGYRTGVVGKWQLLAAKHYPWAGTGSTPEDAGFTEHCLWQVDLLGSRFANPKIVVDGVYLEDTKGQYGPEVFVDHAIDMMREAAEAEEPFFLFYPAALVHDPFVPTPNSSDPTSKDIQRNFADMMAYLDLVVGRLIDSLDDLGISENTLFIFTSDNGTHKSIRSMRNGAEVIGGKTTSTDRATHVPLIVHWPGTAPSGTVCDDLIDLSDILPTALDAASIEMPTDIVLDGRSFLPQIRGEAGEPRDHIHIYSNPRPERPGFRIDWFVRDARWKLYADGRLYDLEADPEELEPIDPEAGGEAGEARSRLTDIFMQYPAYPERIAPEHWKISRELTSEEDPEATPPE